MVGNEITFLVIFYDKYCLKNIIFTDDKRKKNRICITLNENKFNISNKKYYILSPYRDSTTLL